jgi:hypothetical protein
LRQAGDELFNRLRLISLRSKIRSQPKLSVVSIAQLFHRYLVGP